MKLSEVKKALIQLEAVQFNLPDGTAVPAHFHITEVGKIDKHFIDCGGTIRNESVINFQLFTAEDFHHRLGAQKLKSIIELSEEKLNLEDLDIEVEYQSDTIGKFGLEFDGQSFQLTTTQTDCLAKDKCGIPQSKPRMRLTKLGVQTMEGCTPGGGCC